MSVTVSGTSIGGLKVTPTEAPDGAYILDVRLNDTIRAPVAGRDIPFARETIGRESLVPVPDVPHVASVCAVLDLRFRVRLVTG